MRISALNRSIGGVGAHDHSGDQECGDGEEADDQVEASHEYVDMLPQRRGREARHQASRRVSTLQARVPAPRLLLEAHHRDTTKELCFFVAWCLGGEISRYS